jgi:hypothetical protein
MFKASLEALFTPKNIANAFAKTGIFPLKPCTILDKIKRPKLLELEPEKSLHKRTPMSYRLVH